MARAGETVRQRMHRALRKGPATALDLSRELGIPERDVAGHLEHLARSLKHTPERLVVESASCLVCGFGFVQRTRYTRPSRCPKCHSTRIALPVFRVEAG